MPQPSFTDAVEKFIAEVKWRFAKTMPKWPHWYVMKQWNPGREAEFMELVRLIFKEGRDEKWGVGTSSGSQNPDNSLGTASANTDVADGTGHRIGRPT